MAVKSTDDPRHPQIEKIHCQRNAGRDGRSEFHLRVRGPAAHLARGSHRRKYSQGAKKEDRRNREERSVAEIPKYRGSSSVPLEISA